MQLYSLLFVVFLFVFLVLYFLVGRIFGKGQWIVLLAASLIFYLASGWQNIVFILLTSASTWALSLRFSVLDQRCSSERSVAVSRSERKAIRARYKHLKWIWALSGMLLNFGVLAYLKYWNVLLSFVNLSDSFLASRLLLPLGISFYTFQSIGYLIDTYNGKYEPEKNYARYLLFVSFFPQLIQGPINRFDALANQLLAPHHFDVHAARRAGLLIGFGLLKKYALADVLVGIVSNTLDYIDTGTPGCVVIFGILLYTIQQYGDFSGGIDMVRGVSQLFGIEMAQNFRQPYFSTSLSDFWHRWHISLGAWMRDYVFYPLAVRPSLLKLNKWGVAHFGKNIGRTLSACVGNIVVFLLVGLWHGAETHYVLWGLYQGVVIASSDLLRGVFGALTRLTRVNVNSTGYRVFSILRTFFLVNVGRYFDRLTDFNSLITGFYNSIFNLRFDLFWPSLNAHPTFALSLCLLSAALSCVIVFIVSFNKERGIDVTERVLALPCAARFALYLFVTALVAFSFTIANKAAGGFLYANF